jgi:lipoprotein-anchoring transpeptidase ErfK/SrfK
MRRPVIGPVLFGVALLLDLVSCGDGHGRVDAPAVATAPAVTSAPVSRSSPPADAASVRMLGSKETLVAIARGPTLDVHAAPGTQRPYMDLEAENPWGQGLRMLVLRDAVDDDGEIWLRIQLPIWPNGQEGWIAASDVRLAAIPERVVVDLSDRRLIRFREGEQVTRMTVAVGSASTPTPPGRYFVWAKVATDRPSGPYGSFILGLSGFSEAIQPWEWPGEPRLAIHGTDDPGDAGRAVSKGCVRVLNALLGRLRDVPMGTPVLIRP